MNSLINIGLIVTYILLGFTILMLIGFSIYFTIINFKSAKTGLFGIGALFIIMIIAYMVSPANQGQFYSLHKVGPTLSKVIGAGLFSTYFIFIIILILVVYSEVSRWFK